jgi:hypothetical protein
MNLEQFFQRHPSSPSSEAFTVHLPDEVREAMNRGLHVFPVSLPAKLNGQADRLIGEATCDAFRLEELAASPAAHPVCEFRIAIGPSRLCVVQLDGHAGRKQFAAVLDGADECHTLQARRGDLVYAFFLQPAGMKVMGSAKLAPGVSILGESCIVPPFGGTAWINPGAEIEALPNTLRDLLAVENPDNFPGRAMPAPKPSIRPIPCRPPARFPQPNLAPRKGHPNCNQARWNGGYRIYRLR